ncbi:uncharacterized protein LOC143274859 [Babylonia areolata]|uniref:uncharacterized protein LOC143274859 n=1 Tax=Babylonia areolata TaxID=304850 RepID=UPI003FD38161
MTTMVMMMMTRSMKMWRVFVRAVMFQFLLGKGGYTQQFIDTSCQIGEDTCDFNNGIRDCAWTYTSSWTFGPSYARILEDRKDGQLMTRENCTVGDTAHCLIFEYLLTPVVDSQQQPNELDVFQIDTDDVRYLWGVESYGDLGWRTAYVPIIRGNNFKIQIRGRRNFEPAVIGIDTLQYRRQPCRSLSTRPPVSTHHVTDADLSASRGARAQDDDGSGNQLSLVIGLVVSVIVNIACACGLILCYCRKRRVHKRLRVNTNNDRCHFTATDGNIIHLHGDPSALATTALVLPDLDPTRTLNAEIPSSTTAPPPFCARTPKPRTSASTGTEQEDHYHTIDEVASSSTAATTIPIPTYVNAPTPNNTAASRSAAALPPFCARRRKAGPSSVSSGTEEGDHYSTIYEVCIPSTTTTLTTTTAINSNRTYLTPTLPTPINPNATYLTPTLTSPINSDPTYLTPTLTNSDPVTHNSTYLTTTLTNSDPTPHNSTYLTPTLTNSDPITPNPTDLPPTLTTMINPNPAYLTPTLTTTTTTTNTVPTYLAPNLNHFYVPLSNVNSPTPSLPHLPIPAP